MAKIDDDILEARNKLNYYIRKRLKFDNCIKEAKYHTECIKWEEKLCVLTARKNKVKWKSKVRNRSKK